MLSTAQTCQITLVLGGAALVHMAIGAHSPHSVKMSRSPAVVPRHGGHIVAAAQIGFEVLRDAWCWGGGFNIVIYFCIFFILTVFISQILNTVAVALNLFSVPCVWHVLYRPHLSWRTALRSGSCCTFVPQPWRAKCTFPHTADRWCHSRCPMWCSRWSLRFSAPALPCTLLRQEWLTRWCWPCYCHSRLISLHPQEDRELGEEKNCEVRLDMNFLTIYVWYQPLICTYITKTKLLVRHLTAKVRELKIGTKATNGADIKW